jgi:lipoprotein LprG
LPAPVFRATIPADFYCTNKQEGERVNRSLRYLLLVLVCMVLAGCGGQAGPALTPTPTLTPQAISAAVGQAMRASESVHFAVSLSGAPVATDASGLFTLVSLEGDLRRPDGVLAVLELASGSALVEVRTVSLEGRQYATNPLTREWTCMEPGTAFDPAALFAPESGVEYLLENGFSDVTLVGREALAGSEHYHLRGTMDGTDLQDVAQGLVGSGPINVELWADVATMQATRLVLVDTASDTTDPSTWTIEFSDYDKTVDIRAPVDC